MRARQRCLLPHTLPSSMSTTIDQQSEVACGNNHRAMMQLRPLPFLSTARDPENAAAQITGDRNNAFAESPHDMPNYLHT